MSGKTRQNEGESKDNKKLLIVIIIILAVLLVAGAIVLAFVLGKKSSERTANNNTDNSENRETVSSSRLIVDEESSINVYEQMKQEVEDGMFECMMTFDWTFENGESESKDAYVANSSNNRKPFYFDVYLKETDELIYSSPVLPVGTELTNIKLDKSLAAGKYKASCRYSVLKDEDSQEVLSTARFVVNITVLN